ncbi:MAG: ABC transporter permease subunit [Bacteroidota bacterium]
MIKAIIIRELKRNFLAFAITAVVCGMTAIYVISLGPSFGKDIQQILDLKMPKNFQSAFGMAGIDYSNPMGFFGMVFLNIYLLTAIYIAGMFSVIVSKEYRDKTAEFIYSLPGERLNIILSKLTVALAYSVLTVIVTYLFSVIGMRLIIPDAVDLQPILMMSLAWLLGGLALGSLTFLLISFKPESRGSFGLAAGIVMLFYMMQLIISLNENVRWLAYLSPFTWFRGAEIATTGTIGIEFVITALVVCAVCFYFGIKRYRKMDVLI